MRGRRGGILAVGAALALLALPAPAEPARPQPEVIHYVPSHSDRQGAPPSIIVLHSTEGGDRPGLLDLRRLGIFFGRRRLGPSSHVANDAEGNDARFVPDARAAHTQRRYNAVSLSIEQIGFARFSRAQWLARPAQLANTAGWIAHWSERHGIPIRRGLTRRGRVVVPGVVTHDQLSRTGAGSDHWDPGPGYPVEHVLELARGMTEEPEAAG